MECRLTHAIPLGVPAGGGSPATTLVIAQVLHFAVAPGIFERDAAGRLLAIAPEKLDSLGRIGGPTYARTRDRFDLSRPETPAATAQRGGTQ